MERGYMMYFYIILVTYYGFMLCFYVDGHLKMFDKPDNFNTWFKVLTRVCFWNINLEVDVWLLVSRVELMCLDYIASVLLLHIYDMHFDIRVKFESLSSALISDFVCFTSHM